MLDTYPDFQFSNLPHTSKSVNTDVNLMIRRNPLDCSIHCYLSLYHTPRQNITIVQEMCVSSVLLLQRQKGSINRPVQRAIPKCFYKPLI